MNKEQLLKQHTWSTDGQKAIRILIHGIWRAVLVSCAFPSFQTPPPKEYPTLAGWVRDWVVQNASLGTAVAKRKFVAFTGKQTSVF